MIISDVVERQVEMLHGLCVCVCTPLMHVIEEIFAVEQVGPLSLSCVVRAQCVDEEFAMLPPPPLFFKNISLISKVGV